MPAAAARQYDRTARVYDRLWAGYVRDTQDLLDAVARIRPAERVLDVGCGTGTFAARLAARHPGQAVVGVDVSEGMLAEARRKTAAFPSVRFERAPATDLPFDGALFDVVVTASALHYVGRPGDAVAEARRVLRAGGRLAVVDWDRSRWWMAAMDGVLHLADPAHGRTLTAGEIVRLMTDVGLDVRVAERVRRGAWGLTAAVGYRI